MRGILEMGCRMRLFPRIRGSLSGPLRPADSNPMPSFPSILLTAAALTGCLSAQQPRPFQDLTPNASANSVGPAVASDQDLSAVMFVDGADHGIYVRVSDGHGLTWAPAVRVDSDVTGSDKYFLLTGALAVDGDSIYCTWQDGRLSTGGTAASTFFCASHDRGATWSADTVLDMGYPHGLSHPVPRSRIAVDGARAFVAQMVVNGNWELWLTSTADGGATWTPALPVSSSPATIGDFGLDTAGGSCFVAWSDDRNAPLDDDLWFRVSHDGGLSWAGPEVQLDGSGPASGDVEFGWILLRASGSQLSLAWLEDELPTSPLDEELHFRHSPDSGASWGPDRTLASGADVDFPSMSFCGCNAAIAWVDDRTGGDEVYAAVSVDQGATWSEHRLSAAGGYPPRIVGRADYLGVAWVGGSSFPGIPAMAVTRDEGQSWLPSFDLASGALSMVAFVEPAFNEKYKNFVVAWLGLDSGLHRIYAGGLRTQSLLPNGNFTPGGTASFAVEHFAIDEEGFLFGVPVAGGAGHFTPPFPGAFDLGVANDTFLKATLGMIPGPLTGSLGGGSGNTGNVVIPPAIPSGTLLYAVGVSFTVPGPLLRSITDVVVVPVL